MRDTTRKVVALLALATCIASALPSTAGAAPKKRPPAQGTTTTFSFPPHQEGWTSAACGYEGWTCTTDDQSTTVGSGTYDLASGRLTQELEVRSPANGSVPAPTAVKRWSDSTLWNTFYLSRDYSSVNVTATIDLHSAHATKLTTGVLSSIAQTYFVLEVDGSAHGGYAQRPLAVADDAGEVITVGPQTLTVSFNLGRDWNWSPETISYGTYRLEAALYTDVRMAQGSAATLKAGADLTVRSIVVTATP